MTDAQPPTALLHALGQLAEPAPTRLLERLGSVLEVGDYYVEVDGPAGRLWVAFTERGISLLSIASDEDEFRADLAARRGSRPLRRASAPPPGLLHALTARIATERGRPDAGLGGPDVAPGGGLDAGVGGPHTATGGSAWGAVGGPHADPGGGSASVLRYDLSGLSPFQRAVLDKTAEIPRGEVRPYAWVAREVGQPGAVRAVGTALGRNPVPILIPCHRVVRSDGRIGAYALGSSMKSRLLTEEGVDLAELVELATAGIRYVGDVRSRTYCLPTCSAVRPVRPDQRRGFRSAGEAVAAGLRPCPRCRPPADAA